MSRYRQNTTTIPVNFDGRRIGNVGLLLIEAAKQGSRDSLELLFDLPQGRVMIKHDLKADSSYYVCLHL